MAQTLLARNQEAIANHLAYTEFLSCWSTTSSPDAAIGSLPAD